MAIAQRAEQLRALHAEADIVVIAAMGLTHTLPIPGLTHQQRAVAVDPAVAQDQDGREPLRLSCTQLQKSGR